MNYRSYISYHHPHRNIADPTLSPLAINAITIKYRDSFTVTNTRARWVPSDWFFLRWCFSCAKHCVSPYHKYQIHNGHTQSSQSHQCLSTFPQHRPIAFVSCRRFCHEKSLVPFTILTIIVVVNTLLPLLLLAIFFTRRRFFSVCKIPSCLHVGHISRPTLESSREGLK